MSSHPVLGVLRSELESELTQRLLPYWMEHAADSRNGGYVGLVTSDDVPRPDAPKGSILHARILWTFAAAARVLGGRDYHAAARRAAVYFATHFIDPVEGGVYWMVDAGGAPTDDRKHVYAQAFAIYGLSEHFRATREKESLRQAIEIFLLIEKHAHDALHGGYREAFSRDWVPLDDVRLGEGDAEEPKSMNTHLHLLEAYTNLARVWPDPVLRQRLKELIRLFLDTIIAPESSHVRAFFSEDWTPRSTLVSFGHDIETSWLLVEAAEVLADEALHREAQRASLQVAAAVLEQGVDPAGGLFYAVGADGVLDTDKEWWPQAEAIVGFVNAYQESGRDAFLDAAASTWSFAKEHILDRERGEWHWRVARDGAVRPRYEKVGPWKCPYHNGRACLEVITRAAGRAAPAAAPLAAGVAW